MEGRVCVQQRQGQVLAHTHWALSRVKVTLVSIRTQLMDRRTTTKADTKMALSQ